MKVIIGVKNFGKIKSAEINISNFTVFVGNNNSGKTFIMQLIYGVLESFGSFIPTMKAYDVKIGRIYTLQRDEIKELEREINTYLMQNKEKIVLHTFHNPIGIEQLYIKLEMDNEIFQVEFLQEEKYVEEQIHDSTAYVNEENIKLYVNIALKNLITNENVLTNQIAFLRKPGAGIVWRFVYEHMLNMIFETGSRNSTIFIPASRTGMLLLYKYFFAEKSNNDIGAVIEHTEELEKRENELGLSEPVYNFLQFLLRYTPRQTIARQNNDIIEFIQQNLMDGELRQIGEETVYIPNRSDIQIPLYLASSMINEIAPLFKLLTGARQYRRIFYDEIETCLHPLKQGEMARTLFRMNNKGYKMLVSTHSDTMANKINNLLLLSSIDESAETKNEKLKRMKLTEDDLLKSDEFHVYQFVNQLDGTSEVSELEFRTTPPIGYDFSLFMDSVNELYEETSTVME